MIILGLVVNSEPFGDGTVHLFGREILGIGEVVNGWYDTCSEATQIFLPYNDLMSLALPDNMPK